MEVLLKLQKALLEELNGYNARWVEVGGLGGWGGGYNSYQVGG